MLYSTKTVKGREVAVDVDGMYVDIDGIGTLRFTRIERHLHEGVVRWAIPVTINGANTLVMLADEQVGANIHADLIELAEADLERKIPGLHILRNARGEQADYFDAMTAMMEDEGNDGVTPPAPPADYDTLAALHPVAAAYLRAEEYEAASNDVKAAAGHEARALLEAGSVEQALDTLDNWLNGVAID